MWVLLVTAMFSDGSTYVAKFPMATEEECKNEIEWPGNAPYEIMTMGIGFTIDCLPVGGIRT